MPTPRTAPLALVTLALVASRGLAQDSTWIQVGSGSYTSFVVSPDYARDGRVWAAYTVFPTVTQTHVELSTDHGDSFVVQSRIPNSKHITELAISPTFAIDQTLFQAQFRTGQVAHELMRSTNAGATWSPTNLPLMGASVERISVSPAYANDQVVFASRSRSSLWRSTNGGQSWTIPTQGPLRVPGAWDIECAPDYPVSRVVHLWHRRYRTVSRSTDGGATFSTSLTTCSASVPYDLKAAPLGPGSQRFVFAAGLGGTPQFPAPGLYRSIDDGLNYAVADTGLPLGAAVYRVVTPPDFATSGRVYLATDDGVYYSNNYGNSYAPLPAAGLVGERVVDLQLAGGSDGDLYARVATLTAAAGELFRLRLAGTGVVDLGAALAGTNGKPALWASAPVANPRAITLRLNNALGSGLGLQFFGLRRVDVPFATGTFVPEPLLLLPVATSSSGSASTNLQWPVYAPPGTTVYTQTWMPDPAGAAGFASSNALKLTQL